MTHQGECDLCGHFGQVRPDLVDWRVPIGGPFAVDRCVDEPACRARIEADGGVWPIRDKEPA